MSLSQWQSILETHFNKDELRLLSFNLGVDYENLGGETKQRKALELVLALERQGRLPDLLAEIKVSRPKLEIDGLFAPVERSVDKQPNDSVVEVDDATLADIRDKLQRQRLALFIGADLPEAVTDVPSRQGLADVLARQEGLGTGQPLTAVAQQVMRSGNRFRFTDLLRRQLDSTTHSPQLFHRQVVSLIQTYSLKILITTAYDDLLEMAFRQSQIGLNRIITEADLSFSDPAYPTLIKLYGDWQRVDSLTVTEQDTNALLNGRDKAAIVAEIKQVFRRYSILFIGHDLRDPLIQSLFDQVAGDQFQAPAFAVWSDISAAEANAFKSNRGLTVLTAKPNNFLSRLLSSG